METRTRKRFFFCFWLSACTYSVFCNLHFPHPHIIYQGVIGTVIEYFSEAYPVWPTYLCKLAVLGTKAARSCVAVFNPLCCSQVCRRLHHRLSLHAMKGGRCLLVPLTSLSGTLSVLASLKYVWVARCQLYRFLFGYFDFFCIFLILFWTCLIYFLKQYYPETKK